jgi:hypothetical protein
MASCYKSFILLFLGCSFIILEEPCNNQRPKCDITWLHATTHLHNYFPSSMVKQYYGSRLIVEQVNSVYDLIYCV